MTSSNEDKKPKKKIYLNGTEVEFMQHYESLDEEYWVKHEGQWLHLVITQERG